MMMMAPSLSGAGAVEKSEHSDVGVGCKRAGLVGISVVGGSRSVQPSK